MHPIIKQAIKIACYAWVSGFCAGSLTARYWPTLHTLILFVVVPIASVLVIRDIIKRKENKP